MLLSGDAASNRFIHPELHSWAGLTDRLLAAPPSFPYLIYGGRYRLSFAVCESAEDHGSPCGREESGGLVYSDYVNLQPEVLPHCAFAGFQGNASLIEMDAPSLGGMRATFRFAFSPCSPLLPYDAANVTLYSSVRSEECGGAGATAVLMDRLPLEKSTNGGYAVIFYRTPELEVRKKFTPLSMIIKK